MNTGDRKNTSELRRAIQYFGGIDTGNGFEFPSAARRAMALEILAGKYGTRYFQIEDG